MDQVQEMQNRGDEDLIDEYRAFLQDEDGEGVHSGRIREMMGDEKKTGSRLIVDLNKLREYDENLASRTLARPFECIPLFEKALLEVVKDYDPNYLEKLASDEHAMRHTELDKLNNPLHIGLEGSFGQNLVSPRGLSSNFVTQMVAVEGIVTKCSVVRPKVMRSVHYCQETRSHSQQNYQDATDLTGAPTTSVYPSKDANGYPLETEFGLSIYKDHQVFTIQEMPERAPLGQMPRSVDVIADNDLVDVVKPGDRVRVIGIFRALAGQASGSTSGVFRTVVLSNNIEQMTKQVAATSTTARDIQHIRNLSKRKDVFDLLSRSLAPSIYGHKYIKQAIALMLVGGMEKNLSNGTHIRGDINMLMVGDPSTAKSQLLRFTQGISPLAVNATGRGSSGVGLTAAVTTDPETGDRRLEAGAMVLADRGIVCIDEFDKMSDIDRVSIHEAMEQQTVTIAKAGIQAQLNARCSVVAAANPIYGAYDTTMPPQANVNLPDSLLSRFDLLFIVIDDLNPERDTAIADHVLRTHRYVKAGQEGRPIPLDATANDTAEFESFNDREDEEEGDDETTPVFQKFNPLLHGGAAAEASQGSKRKNKRGGSSSDRVEVLHSEFIKKYVQYAKQRVKPELTDDAREDIVTAYNDMRQKADSVHVSTPVTARALETLIRLSTAHAKLRLSRRVEKTDVKRSVEILSFALFDAQPEEVKRKKRKADDEEPELSSDDSDDDDDKKTTPKKATTRKRTPRKAPATKKQRTSRKQEEEDEVEDETEDDEEDESDTEQGESSAAAASASSASAPAQSFSPTIVREFTRGIARLFRREGEALTERLIQQELCEKDNSPESLKSLGRKDVMQLLQHLHDEGKIMYSDGCAHYL
eukprot:gb/GECG01007242.1/.p1 GENE.gb/GECG01007242.1/~~gb/GECG01007242.1/.p1  ORF type:complete len:869 (+),score=162.56 gb/GECG01007242.1/:1-2607(+)